MGAGSNMACECMRRPENLRFGCCRLPFTEVNPEDCPDCGCPSCCTNDDSPLTLYANMEDVCGYWVIDHWVYCRGERWVWEKNLSPLWCIWDYAYSTDCQATVIDCHQPGYWTVTLGYVGGSCTYQRRSKRGWDTVAGTYSLASGDACCPSELTIYEPT